MIVKVIKNTYTAEPLYQWDINQVLRVYGLSLARVPEVHFINQAMSKAIVRQARMDDKGVVSVDVPNSLLQKPYTITAYICGYNGTTFETHHKLDIPVNKRPKPADYALTNDPEVYSFKALENAVQNALHDLSDAEVKLDAATGDLKDAEAVLQQAVKDIDNTVDESVRNALPGFLDDTLTKSDKAAQAAAVGAAFDAVDARLDGLDAQHTIEKIADVTITKETSKLYIELPQTLSHYPLLIFKAVGVHCTHNPGATAYLYAVENTESTTTLFEVLHFSVGAKDNGMTRFATILPATKSDGSVTGACWYGDAGAEVDCHSFDGADTKYLYTAPPYALAAGSHFEIWGVAK